MFRRAMLFDRALDFADYQILMGAFSDIWELSEGCLPFWLGDLLNEVEMRYGETYAQLIDALPGYRIETLRNYKWVCSRVTPDMRLRVQAPVTFTACRTVAGLEPEKREEALTLSALNDWSSRELIEWTQQEETSFQPQEVKARPLAKIERLLSDAFEALAQRDLERAGDLIDSALIAIRRIM